MHKAFGKRQGPAVIRPQITAAEGTNGGSSEVPNIARSKTLAERDIQPEINVPVELGDGKSREAEDPAELDLFAELLTDSEWSDDELDLAGPILSEKPDEKPVQLSTLITDKTLETVVENSVDNNPTIESLKFWRPMGVISNNSSRLIQRRICCAENGLVEPEKVTKTPAEISIFGEKIRGILDSGSERSYLSPVVYDCVKKFQVKEISEDATSKNGVRLGDKSIVKTKGGTCFVIDVGDVYGLQWFSILPKLSNDMILGMDFWLAFKVKIDPSARMWTLEGSGYSYSMSSRYVVQTELKTLTVDQANKLKTFLGSEFAKFDKESTGMTDLIKHVIVLSNPTPHRQKPYRRSERVREFINTEVDRLLEKGFVTWSKSDWACSPVVAPKANGGLRFCVDYRPLNRQTVKPAYPLQHMHSILSQLHQAKIISTIDMSEAFHQIPMDKDCQKYTAFAVEGKGLLEWTRMPYGLTGAPATFQNLMDQLKRRVKELILERNLPNKWGDQIFAYLDDWVILSQDIDEHLKLLSLLFEVLREAKLIINHEKSSFACKEVKFLGYIVDEFGMRPNPEKVQPILDFPIPKDRTQLRQFNGLVNWYHRHMKNIARIQGPLNKLTSPKVPWKWTEVEQRAFDETKAALAKAPRLSIPIPGHPFILYTDASDFGLGAILVQYDPDGKRENLIEVLSRPLRGAELHYTTTEKECLAVVWAVGKLRCYLEAMPFKVVTDHQALQWLHGLKNPVGRLARWAIYLLQHNMTVEYRRGTTNEAPDALSRIHDVDVDPIGWEKIIQETIQTRTQLRSICDQDWYETKRNLVSKQPLRFCEWKVENDELYYYRPDYAKMLIDDENPWKRVARSNEVPNILQENHETPQSGHLGRDSTYDRIRQKYYWPGMSRDVKSYVEDCEVCMKVKSNQNPLTGPLMTRPLIRPWAQLSIDTIGPLTRSKKGNAYIIVVQDLYTKFVELFPVRNQTGKIVVKILDIIFDKWGVIPESIISDNGTEYINKDLKAFLMAHKINHVTTPLAHPQANPVERVNRTVKPMIAAFIKSDQNTWDESLSKLQLAYNTVPHSGSRVSPFYLNHAREANTDSRKRIVSGTQTVSDEMVNNWIERIARFDELRHKVEIQVKKYSDKRLATANQNKAKPISIKIGAEVYYPNKKLSSKAEGYSSKLGHRYLGPAMVKRVMGPMIVELVDKNDKYVGKYYVTDLKFPRRSRRTMEGIHPATDRNHAIDK